MIRPYMNKDGTIKKVAFNINLDPSSIVGALTGGFIAKKKVEKDHAKAVRDAMMPQRIGPEGHTGYLKDFANLEQNLQIVFTPLGVIYLVKDGPREYAVDQISVSEMDQGVKEKFNMQDRMFFKNILLNKVRADINMAERLFTKRLIDQQLASEFNNINKQASEISEPFQTFIDGFDDEAVAVELGESDINKVAFLSKIKGFVNPREEGSEMAKLQGSLDDPDYLSKKVDIGFMPDRVLFIVDGIVVSQMNVMDMNDEGFKAFNDNNNDYFMNFFRGKIKPMQSVDTVGLFKKASEAPDLVSLFYTPMIHPMVYKMLLDRDLGLDWLQMDPEVILHEIEKTYGIEETMNDLVMNKIMMIASANNPDPVVFENMQSFEKAIRAMVDKPINFEEDERNISLGEIVFGIKCLQDITPFKDITDVMSEGVLTYIIDVLSSQGYRLIYPDDVSESEEAMYQYIDKEVRETVLKFIVSGSDDRDVKLSKSRVVSNIVTRISKDVVDHFRQNGLNTLDDIDDECIKRWERIKSVMDGSVDDLDVPTLITIKAVHDNLAVDVYMAQQESVLEESILKFNLGGDIDG